MLAGRAVPGGRRSVSPASGSVEAADCSTWRSSSPPRGRRPATGRSRCGLFLRTVVHVREAVTEAHHDEWAWVSASLTRRSATDIAEEGCEVFATRVERWPGVATDPRRPTTTANRKAIDRIRAKNKRAASRGRAEPSYDDPPGPRRHRRRAAPADLDPPSPCCDADPRGADADHGRRPDPRPDRRAFLVVDHHGAADHPREGQDQGGSYPLPGAVRGYPGTGLGVLAVLFLVFNEGYLTIRPSTIPSVTT